MFFFLYFINLHIHTCTHTHTNTHTHTHKHTHPYAHDRNCGVSDFRPTLWGRMKSLLLFTAISFCAVVDKLHTLSMIVTIINWGWGTFFKNIHSLWGLACCGDFPTLSIHCGDCPHNAGTQTHTLWGLLFSSFSHYFVAGGDMKWSFPPLPFPPY